MAHRYCRVQSVHPVSMTNHTPQLLDCGDRLAASSVGANRGDSFAHGVSRERR